MIGESNSSNTIFQSLLIPIMASEMGPTCADCKKEVINGVVCNKKIICTNCNKKKLVCFLCHIDMEDGMVCLEKNVCFNCWLGRPKPTCEICKEEKEHKLDWCMLCSTHSYCDETEKCLICGIKVDCCPRCEKIIKSQHEIYVSANGTIDIDGQGIARCTNCAGKCMGSFNGKCQCGDGCDDDESL